MIDSSADLPLLPLVLWKVPPALEAILQQVGIPCTRIDLPAPFAFRAGRFVIHDSTLHPPHSLRPLLSRTHHAIDINALRVSSPTDPFRDWLSTRAARLRWRIDGLTVRERACRVDKAAIRARVTDWLRARILAHGGLWASLSPFPHPYRSAFNLRVDLDEPVPDDYFRFARLRQPFEDCTTHFLNTAAYAAHADVLADLRGRDTQSHAHHHIVYRDRAQNQSNVTRAHDALHRQGFNIQGFAAPTGRWNHGLDNVLEDLGYLYSSDFQTAYDDLPSFPWKHDRFSRVLQVPIHPVCEGIFLEAGDRDGRRAAAHLARVARARIEAGETAFVYGHPERRLAHCPEILDALTHTLDSAPLVWRATLTDFARWWAWRIAQRFSVARVSASTCAVRFESRAARYPLALVIDHGTHTATVPVRGPETIIPFDQLILERRRLRADVPTPTRDWHIKGPRDWLHAVLDWDAVTPLAELPDASLRDRLKKSLRAWKSKRPTKSKASAS